VDLNGTIDLTGDPFVEEEEPESPSGPLILLPGGLALPAARSATA
jgi:hypothetical protein